jgi:hypothetical protein
MNPREGWRAKRSTDQGLSVFKYSITSARSASSFKPGKAIRVRGTTPRGSVRNSSRASDAAQELALGQKLGRFQRRRDGHGVAQAQFAVTDAKRGLQDVAVAQIGALARRRPVRSNYEPPGAGPVENTGEKGRAREVRQAQPVDAAVAADDDGAALPWLPPLRQFDLSIVVSVGAVMATCFAHRAVMMSEPVEKAPVRRSLWNRMSSGRA